MVVTTVITILCLAGIAFCVRFIVALGKDCKARGTYTNKQFLERHETGLDMDCSLGSLDNTD
jgi:hypothetical protein